MRRVVTIGDVVARWYAWAYLAGLDDRVTKEMESMIEDLKRWKANQLSRLAEFLPEHD